MVIGKKKVSAMVPVYGSLVAKGEKSLSEVPEVLREDVRQWLIDNGHEELVAEE